jgi:hypothetical protein
MKNNISGVVRKTLQEKYEIDQQFNLLLEDNNLNNDDKFFKLVNILGDLSDKGKTEEEINSILNEQEGISGWFSKLLKPGADQTSSERGINPGVGDFGQKMGSAVSSQIREALLSYGLGLLGFKGRLKESFAIVMADLDIRYLIGMFRGGKNCEAYAPPVMDALVEGIGRYMMTDIEKDSKIGGLLGNSIFEYFRASDLGEKMASIVCTVIPKK